MKSNMHRHLVVAESWLLLAPATVVTLVCCLFAGLFALAGDPAKLLVVVNGAIAMASLFATWVAVGAYRARGDEGLVELGRRTVFAMQAGVLLVAIGALAVLVERVAAPVDTGALMFNVLGVPAVVPCAHLLWLRWRAMRARVTPASTRTWPALIALAIVLPALQWVMTGPMEFDRASWDAQANKSRDPWHRRQRMADALVLDGSLVGRSRAEVVAMLGEPDSGNQSLVYVLGEGREITGFGADSLWVSLDAQQRVTDVQILADDD